MYAQMKSILAAGCLVAASTLGVAAFEAVTVEPVEMREGPGEDFEPIVELPEGTVVEVLNCDREWCEASVEDYDGFIPRGALDLGTVSPPAYLFPPLISRPSLWHGRYFSRDHFRYESRSRWRNREGRRIHVVPERRQLRPLRPIDPNARRGKKQFDQRGPTTDQRGKKQFDQKGPTTDQRGKKQFDQKGPTTDQRGKKQFDRRGPATDQPRIQRAPDQPRIQRAPDQPRPKIQQQTPVQRQAPSPPPQKQPEKKKQDQKG